MLSFHVKKNQVNRVSRQFTKAPANPSQKCPQMSKNLGIFDPTSLADPDILYKTLPMLFRARLRISRRPKLIFWSEIHDEAGEFFRLPCRLFAAHQHNPLKKWAKCAENWYKENPLSLRCQSIRPIVLCFVWSFVMHASPPGVPCGARF